MKPVAIDTAGITHKFADLTALENVTLSIPSGSVFGLLGPNGAGKTTMVRVLNGVITPTSAQQISILGFDIKEQIQEIRQRVGVLTDTNLYERLSALDNLSYFGEIYGLSKDGALKRANGLLAQFGLSARAKDKVETFSKGMKQKVAIARALIGDPELVYLDEPTAGLDPEASFELLQYIKEVSSDSSKTFFITSHRLEEMESICDIVAILNKGNIQAIGAPHELARQVFNDHWVAIKLGAADNCKSDAANQTGEPTANTMLDINALQEKLPFILDVRQVNGEIKLMITGRDAIPALVRYLGGIEADIYGISEDVPTLHDAYLALVKENR